MPLDRDAAWYARPEASPRGRRHRQLPDPGRRLSKNQAAHRRPAPAGPALRRRQRLRALSENDFDAPRDPRWNYVGTLDNNATITELRFLAGSGQPASKPRCPAWPGQLPARRATRRLAAPVPERRLVIPRSGRRWRAAIHDAHHTVATTPSTEAATLLPTCPRVRALRLLRRPICASRPPPAARSRGWPAPSWPPAGGGRRQAHHAGPQQHDALTFAKPVAGLHPRARRAADRGKRRPADLSDESEAWIGRPPVEAVRTRAPTIWRPSC